MRAFLALAAAVSALGVASELASESARARVESTPGSTQPSNAAVGQPTGVAVVAITPSGDRVALDAPLALRFSADVEPRDVLVDVEPTVSGRVLRAGPRTLVFRPDAWRAGRVHRVRIWGRARDGADLIPSEWTFRALVPAPERVEPGGGKPLVLTFDDGPHRRGQADELLDVLRKHDARALFFPTGRWARSRPDWVARALSEGHRVCNHSSTHVSLTSAGMTEAKIRSEIENGAGHGVCKLLRPPLMAYDRRVSKVASSLGYELFFWDIDSRDWEGAPAEDIMNLVLSRARPEAVVLFHLHAETTLSVLPELLRRLKQEGYALSHDATPRRELPSGEDTRALMQDEDAPLPE